MNPISIAETPALANPEVARPSTRRLSLALRLSDAHIAQLLFAGVFLFLCLWHGTRLVLETNDEGIIPDAAQRMLSGSRLYADFFGYMAPGSYWIQELAFRILGLNLLAVRVPVLLDVAVQVALLFWLARLLTNRAAALVGAGFFFWLEVWKLSMITSQHRWDSGTFALAAVCCAWKARSGRPGIWLFLSGCLLSAAALCTPSVALAGVAILAWIIFEPAVRRSVLAWIAGAALILDAAAAVLWRSGELMGFFDQMLWLRQHYSGVNTMPYGSVIGGYSSLLGDARGFDFFASCLLVLLVAIPAVCPVAGTAAGLTWILRPSDTARRSLATLLTATALAMVVSTFPRMDVAHLAWVMAIPFVLAFAGIAAVPNRHVQGAILAAVCLCCLLVLPRWFVSLTEKSVSTPVGNLRVSSPEAAGVSALLGRVHPGDSLYVHPYMPLLYFLTQGRNPTPYSYLAPGMMTSAEADEVLGTLNRQPPKWVLYTSIDAREYLRMFPAADPREVRYLNLEDWIAKNYRPTGVVVTHYQLLRRIEPERNQP